MAITNGYATAAELKTRLGIDDTSSDTVLENIIEATSRAIDAYCMRRFYAATETRYFQSRDADHMWVPDLLSVTTLQTDHDGDRTYEYTWAATDYDLLPANATLDGWPYNEIATTPAGNYFFPTSNNAKSVKITGSWGFASTTPDAVNEACLIVAAQFFMRKDAPWGVSGGSGFIQQIKQVLRDDPQVRALLGQYRQYL